MSSSVFRNILVITKREFGAYFTSPVAYVFLVIFLLVSGFFTFMVGQDFFSRNEASLGSFFLWHPWLYLFLVPAIAMRLWSEEKRTGTLELLLTLPITTGQAVIGKFLASWAFLIVCLILTFPIWLIPNILGEPDNGAILCGYIGSALMAGAYLGIGSMTSALTRNQVISFVISVLLCLFTILAGFPPVTDFIQGLFPGNEFIVDLIANFSVMSHFEALQRGVFLFRDFIFFLSVILFTLAVTTVIIRGGQESKPAQAFGFAGAQVLVLAGTLVVVNFISLSFQGKWDLTKDNIHTLSDGTKNILQRVNKERDSDPDAFKIDARLYFTRGDDRISPFVRQYASRVSELLQEYEQASKGSLIFNNINPLPDTDEEELAQQDNISRMQIGLDEFAYIGLTLSYADKSEMVSLLEQGPGGRVGGLKPESLLEYEISSAITRLMKDDSLAPVIGVMSPLQINGGFPPNLPPQMMRGQRPAPPWLFMRQLQATYGQSNVKTIEMSASSIEENGRIDLLILVHPKLISEKTQFAIDQYILRGGKVFAFLDSNHALDQGPMGGFSPPTGSSSDLDKLLPAWGVNFTANRVVADVGFALRPRQSGESWPTTIDIQTEGHNEDDPIMRNLGPLCGIHFGAFIPETNINKSNTPKLVPLLHSSTNSALIDSPRTGALLPLPVFQQAQGNIAKSFEPTEGKSILALKLSGDFRSAFPEGDPDKPQLEGDENGTNKKAPDNALRVVREGASPVVVLMGDVDFIHDTNQQLDQFRGFRNSNFNFVLNTIDYLTGDEDLINIRSLTNRSRPLKKLNEMEEKATAEIRKELEITEKELHEAEDKAQDVANKLQDQLQNALQSGQSGIIQLRVSEEDRKKLEQSQAAAEEAKDRARKAIRRIKKQRRQAIDSLRNRIKWASIGAMPLVVAFFGVGITLRNRKTSTAR